MDKILFIKHVTEILQKLEASKMLDNFNDIKELVNEHKDKISLEELKNIKNLDDVIKWIINLAKELLGDKASVVDSVLSGDLKDSASSLLGFLGNKLI